MKLSEKIEFPKFTGIRCLMMPYIQGYSESVSDEYMPYKKILDSVFLVKGEIGFLTIDESFVSKGKPHRAARANFGRALHTEVGKDPSKTYYHWGGGWGKSHSVTLDGDTEILISSNVSNSCAIWDAKHENTSLDGDIGYDSDLYPYDKALFLDAGEIAKIGILTPHESLPVKEGVNRQFLRIISSGVHGREEYFTTNPLVPFN